MSRAQRIVILTTAVAVAATRLLALSAHPWDWDEILFCLGLRDYNMQAHQPHPPGFPLYIALAKVVRLFTDTDFAALRAINVAAAMTVFPVAFTLGRALRLDFRTAYCAALIVSFLPNVWFYGGTAFSDLPALVLYLAAAAVLLGGERYAIGSLLLGAALLIRPHSFLIAIYPWTAATLRRLRAGDRRTVIVTVLVVTLLVGAGYGAAAYVTGFDAFTATMRTHSRFVAQTDSIQSTARPPLMKIVAMQFDPYQAGKVSLLLNILALIGIVFGRRQVTAEVLLTFLPFFVFMTFSLSAVGFSRLSLGYIAGIAILAASGIDAIARRVPKLDLAVRGLFVGAIVGRLIWWMLPAFEQPRTTVPPPNAAALWLRRNTDPKTSKLYVHHGMWPWARYYLDDRTWEPIGDDIGLTSGRDVRGEWLLRAGHSLSVNSANFARPHNRTWNVVAQRYFDAHAKPVSDIVFFGTGWYPIEWSETQTWRWMTRRSTMLLPPLGGTCELRLRFGAPVDALGHPVRVRFSLNGAPLGETLATRVDDNEVRFVVRARAGAPNVLRIEVSDTIRAEGDSRALGLRLWAWGWRQIAP